MGNLRYNKKTDHNQAEIVEALRAIPGCTVCVIHEPVDLLVGWLHKSWLFEVKNPDGKNLITDNQQEFMDGWTGGPVHVVHGVHEIIQIITGQVP